MQRLQGFFEGPFTARHTQAFEQFGALYIHNLADTPDPAATRTD